MSHWLADYFFILFIKLILYLAIKCLILHLAFQSFLPLQIHPNISSNNQAIPAPDHSVVTSNPHLNQPAGIAITIRSVDIHRYPNQFIVNLGDYKLSEPEISILSKGLKFCPTPGYHEVSEVQSDLDHFHRQLRIKHFFQ